MDALANITQADINNGALTRLLNNAGIHDVPQYVRNFHQETEVLVVNKFEQSNQQEIDDYDEQIVPPADIRSWISGFRPRFDESIEPLARKEDHKEQKQQQQLPRDMHGWMKGLTPADVLSENISQAEEQPKQQQQLPQDVQTWMIGLRPRLEEPYSPVTPQQPPPSHPQQSKPQEPTTTDLKGWMGRIAPKESFTSANNLVTETTATYEGDGDPAMTGNLSSWLIDWSKSLGEIPPPTSLDGWLKSLIPQDVTQSLNQNTSPKKRLNNYLNAAQEVLSKHGYNVTNDTAPLTAVQPKTGMFGNVKHMYFLWKVLDKNNDRKITVEDVQIMLQETGLGFLSKAVAQSLFEMVDSNHDGQLSFRDCIALMGIIKELVGAVGTANKKA